MTRTSPLRFLLNAVLCLVLVVAIGAARQLEISHSGLTAPIPTAGAIGGEVDAGTFTIEVHGVEVASAVATAGGFGEEESEIHEAAGVWVVVQATLTAAESRLRVNDPVSLQTGGGYSFAGAGELDGTLIDEWLDPGIPLTGMFALDLPAEHLDDPVLRVNAAGMDRRLSAEAVIDLRLDPDTARAAQDGDSVVEIAPPTTD